jgi:hypothetical protein
MNGIGCDNCCAIPPGRGPECMCECHDEDSRPTGDLDELIRDVTQDERGITVRAFDWLT